MSRTDPDKNDDLGSKFKATMTENVSQSDEKEFAKKSNVAVKDILTFYLNQ